jgi:hypothetical protein
MALTMGLVQSLHTTTPGAGRAFACVYVGPTPSNVVLFALRRQVSDTAEVDAVKVNMVQLLAQAFASGREVIIGHDDADSLILHVELR